MSKPNEEEVTRIVDTQIVQAVEAEDEDTAARLLSELVKLDPNLARNPTYKIIKAWVDAENTYGADVGRAYRHAVQNVSLFAVTYRQNTLDPE